jgi:hypothetical protein
MSGDVCLFLRQLALVTVYNAESIINDPLSAPSHSVVLYN